MNKSKFLKKSLAALLAILMVAAMIPLSAAAADPIVLGDGSIKASAGTLTRNEEGNDFLWTDALPYNVSAETVTITTDMENIEWYDVSGETPSRLATGKSVDVKVTGMAVGTDVTKTVEMRDTSKGNEVVGTYTITFTKLATSTSTELKSAKATISGEEYTTTEIDNAAHTITFSKLPWGVVDALNTTHTNLTVLSVEMAAPHSDAAKYTFNGTNANISAVQDTVDEGKAEIIVTAQSGKEQPYTVHFVESPCLTKLTIGGVEATLNTDDEYEVSLSDLASPLSISIETAKTRGVSYKLGAENADFTDSAAYMVLANDGTDDISAKVIAAGKYDLNISDGTNDKTYTINVKVVKNSDTKVKSFTVAAGTYREEGVVAENGNLSVALASNVTLPIDDNSATVELKMNGAVTRVTLNGTAGTLTGENKTVTFSGANLNATNSLVVVAEDGTQKTYELKATVDAASTKKPALISGTIKVGGKTYTGTPVTTATPNKQLVFALSTTDKAAAEIGVVINEALTAKASVLSAGTPTFTVEESGTKREVTVADKTATVALDDKTSNAASNVTVKVTVAGGSKVYKGNFANSDPAEENLAPTEAETVDLSSDVEYTVVSQDGSEKVVYTLSAVQDIAVKKVTFVNADTTKNVVVTFTESEETPGTFLGTAVLLAANFDEAALADQEITVDAPTGVTPITLKDKDDSNLTAADSGSENHYNISEFDFTDAKIKFTTTDSTNSYNYEITLLNTAPAANAFRAYNAAPNSVSTDGIFTWVTSAHSRAELTVKGAAKDVPDFFVDEDANGYDAATESYFSLVLTGSAPAPNDTDTYDVVFVTEAAKSESRLDSIAFHDAKSKDEVKATYKADVTQSPAEATVSTKLPYKLVEDSTNLAVEYSISENAKLYYNTKDSEILLPLDGVAFDADTGKASLTIGADVLVTVKQLVVVAENGTQPNGTSDTISNLTADTYTTYAFKAEREEPSAEAELLTLGTADNAVTSVIDTGAGTVEVTVPASYVEEGKETEFDLAVTASENATLDPADAKGVYVDAKVVEDNGKYKLMLDGSARTSIVVTAQDGKTKNTYAVTVKTREVESDATITGITVKDVAAEAGEENAYAVTLPAGTEYTAEDIVVATTSDTAKAVVEAGETEGVYTITVTAEDGVTTATYTLTVTVDDEPVIPAELKLESLTIGGVAVDLEAAELAVELPYGTELTEALAVEAIAAAGEAVKVESAVVVNEDGTAAVTVTVTDVNDETKTATYTVAVTVATEEPVLDSDASISGITVKDVAAEAGEENAYAVTLPAGTEYTAEDIVVATTSEKATAEVKAGETEGVYTITVTAEDGTVAEYTLTVTVEAAPVENPFQDIDPEDPDQWYAKSVLNAAAKGYIFGYDDGNFHAADNVTRAQFAAFVARLDGFDKDAAYELNFSDMEYVYGDLKAAVGYCVSKGYMNGYGGTTKFGPNDTITRQEMAIVLAKVLKLDTKNVTVTEKFEDDDKIADWAYNAVYACKNAGYLSGDGKNFDPTGSTDRGMAAVVLMQMDSAK